MTKESYQEAYKKLWEENFELIVKYINLSEKNKKFFEKRGNIPYSATIEKNGEMYNIGIWLANQRKTLMEKYHGMSIEEILKEENIPEKDKYKMRKLLNLGISYSKNKKEFSEEWEENFDLLVKYINSSNKNKKYFEKVGSIPYYSIVKKGEKDFNLGTWLGMQRVKLLGKYKDMSIEEINNDENISLKDKKHILKLLQLGVSYIEPKVKTNEEIWDENFNLLQKYIDSSEEIKQDFIKTGRIPAPVIVHENGKTVRIGAWLSAQRFLIMNKYFGMTLEQVEKNENMPTEDKYRLEKLLKLGVKYAKYEEKSRESRWDETFELLLQYINSSEKNKRFFKEKGRIPTATVIEVNGKRIKLGTWLENQRYFFIEKNNGRNIETIDDIEDSENMTEKDKSRIKKFLQVGINLKYEDELNKFTWEERFNLVNEYINLSEKNMLNFNKKGVIPQDAKIESRGRIVNIGSWLNTQKQTLMKKYQGMSIEQIENDESISQIEKKRMKMLLTLGVSYPKIKAQQIGKSSYSSSVNECDNASYLVQELVNNKRKGEKVING